MGLTAELAMRFWPVAARSLVHLPLSICRHKHLTAVSVLTLLKLGLVAVTVTITITIARPPFLP
jgi:hypothetical protein